MNKLPKTYAGLLAGGVSTCSVAINSPLIGNGAICLQKTVEEVVNVIRENYLGEYEYKTETLGIRWLNGYAGGELLPSDL